MRKKSRIRTYAKYASIIALFPPLCFLYALAEVDILAFSIETIYMTDAILPLFVEYVCVL